MKLMTRQAKAARVAARWNSVYGRYQKSNGEQGILKMLVALGANPKPDEVDRVIGNDSWTSLENCDECGAESVETVEIGEEPDYESSTSCVCAGCLRKALALIGRAT